MSKPMVRIHNLETDEIIDREMTDDEFAQYAANGKVTERIQAEAQAKEAQRKALLDRLGITEEEAKLLLG